MTIAEKILSMTPEQLGVFLFQFYNRAQSDKAYGLDTESSIKYMMNQPEQRFDELIDMEYFKFITNCLDDVGYCHINMNLPEFNKLIGIYGNRISYSYGAYRLDDLK